MIKKMLSKYTSNERKNLKWIFLFLLPSILIFLIFNMIPIITIFVTSFTKWDGFNTPQFIGVDNFTRLFQDNTFIISSINLLKWSVLASTVHVGFGVLVAFILYEKPIGGKFTKSVFMIPNVISAAAWALIFKFLFDNEMGVINSFVRIIFPDFNVSWLNSSPYAFWAVTLTWLFFAVIVTLIVLNELLAIPDSLIEAAQIDGATKWDIVKRIQLPMCRKSIGTSVIASITARVAMYEQIALTTSGGPEDDTMNLPLMLVNSINNYNYGYANTIGVMMIIFGLVTLVAVNKLFRMND
ncbi:carbohydrate ABC transporter permease [Dolosigranulum pigrum]|uniref:carbohydrate ABC transporter permease n=1 Tax=Dolosigranulum pigrum TaxID=29394 RepID=UPI000DBF7BEE|nr:sugar ABC transporter permease [Dolosigranulum pigrum]RAN65097.1 ABC transporter permease [Dolosigranulum pigrum]